MALFGYFTLVLLALVLLALPFTSDSLSNYDNCVTSRSVLLEALFEAGNIEDIVEKFYPQNSRATRYIEVKYTFEKNESSDNICSVTYIWSKGEFLFVQSPKLFMFTSLLFSYPANDVDNVTLTLPYQCRGLVQTNPNETCNCKDSKSTQLGRITEQIDQIPKYTDPSHVVRDITSSAHVVCEEQLTDTYLGIEEVVYISFATSLPLITLAILIIILRSTRTIIAENLIKRGENHPNLAGFVLVGTFLLIFVLCIDFTAFHYVMNDFDGAFNSTKSTVVLVFTFIMNILMAGQFIVHVIYLCCPVSDCCIKLYFIVIFGRKFSEEDAYTKGNYRITWVVTGLIVAPFFCLVSHIGYILMAWVTEPSRAIETFIIAVGSFLFLFFMFRQCYIIHKDNTSCRPDYQAMSSTECCKKNLFSTCCKKKTNGSGVRVQLEEEVTRSAELEESSHLLRTSAEEGSQSTDEKDIEFSISGLFIAFCFGWLFALCLAFVIGSFSLLPFSTIGLIDSLKTIVQIGIAVLAFLVAYKAFRKAKEAIAKSNNLAA